MDAEKVAAGLAGTSGALMLNNAVPKGRRAALVGFSSTICGPVRVLGPALTSPVFAWSLIEGTKIGVPFDRSLTFVAFGLAEGAALWICCLMPRTIDDAR